RRAQGRAGDRLLLKDGPEDDSSVACHQIDVASVCARELGCRRPGRRCGREVRSYPYGPDQCPAAASRWSGAVLAGADQLCIETDRGVRSLTEVAEVQALVLRVRVRVGVLDADQQRRSAQLAREGIHEGDRPAAADGHRLLAVAVAERLAG